MKYLFSLFALLWSTTAFSQIKTLEIEKEIVPVPQRTVGVYDGSVNFLPDEDFEQYIGQVFYMPKCTDEQSYKARKLYVKNPKKRKKKPLLDSKSLWDAMGKYYEVVGIEDIKTYSYSRYILLKDKEDGTIYYYRSVLRERGFPFIVVSYYERMKKEIIGDTIHFKGSNVTKFNLNKEEFPTTASISILPFVCTDYVIDEQQQKWEEVFFMQNGDSLHIRLSLYWASVCRSTDKEVEEFRIYNDNWNRIVAKNAESDRQDQAIIDTTLSQANKLIGTTIYNYRRFFEKVSPTNEKENAGIKNFNKNTPFEVVRIGYNEMDKFEVTLYFKDADGQLYMEPICFHEAWSHKHFDKVFSKNDIRKQHMNISEKNWSKIKRGLVEIGMTMEECFVAKGSPESIDSIETAQSNTTIVRYYKTDLYFRNGRLVAIQD